MSKILDVKEFKISEVIAAIEENGFEHLRGQWYMDSFGGKLTGGCVIQQGALNLGVPSNEDGDGIPYWEDYIPSESLIKDIKENLDIGDEVEDYILSEALAAYNLIDQLDQYKVRKNSRWNINSKYIRSGSACGATIVNWNDKIDTVTKEYALPTYADVVKMVKSVLNPHKNKTVKLLVVDYSAANLVRMPNA